MSAQAIAPTRTERTQAYKNASWPDRVAVHDAIAACKADVIAKRRDLGRRYLAAHPVGPIVPYERAVMFTDLAAETAAARAEAIALAKDKEFQHKSDSLHYLVMGGDFAAD